MTKPSPIWPRLSLYFRQRPDRLLPPKIMNAMGELTQLETQVLLLKTQVNQLVARLCEPTD